MKTTLEIWLPIKGYEGLYEVSNFGRVRSLPRNTAINRIIKQYLRGRTNREYYFVRLSKDGIIKNYYVHRLVAEAFIPNPLNLPQINHRDENHLNNCVENLEWCNAKYNANYGTRVKRVTEKISKRIAQYSLDGVLITIFSSLHEASRQTGIDYRNISMCCLGKHKTAGGFIWRYLE